MTDAETFLPIVLPAALLLLFGAIFGSLALRSLERRRLLREGELGMARVVSVSQTGTMVNQRPEMRIVLDIERGGEATRRVTTRQVLDLGSMPRAGDRVYVMIDPRNPEMVTLAPSPGGEGVRVQAAGQGGQGERQVSLADPVVRDALALSPRLRERGNLGVAQVAALSPTETTATAITLDIDAIGAPLRRLTIEQVIDGPAPGVGDRVYILIDPDDPACAALLPPSMSGGQAIPPGANRLDPLVLGPRLLEAGAKATGTIRTAAELPMADRKLAEAGCSKWRLDIGVQPEAGVAYQATLTIALTSPEKAARIARPGATVPLRYDPADPQTFAIDSPAMGYPNPYDEVLKMVQAPG